MARSSSSCLPPPAPNAISPPSVCPERSGLTIAAALLGGLALLLGVYTRIVALAFVPLMLGTIAFAHGSKGFMFSNPGGGWEFFAFWTAALLAQALLGDGAFSLRRTR